jgi:hypothetical protein
MKRLLLALLILLTASPVFAQEQTARMSLAVVGGGVPAAGGGSTLRNNLVGAWVLTSANTGTRTTNLSQEATKLGNLTNVGADEGATGYTFIAGNNDVMYVSDAGITGLSEMTVILRFAPTADFAGSRRLFHYNDGNHGMMILNTSDTKFLMLAGDGGAAWGNSAILPDRQRSAAWSAATFYALALVVNGATHTITRSYVSKSLLADTGEATTWGSGSDQGIISIGMRTEGAGPTFGMPADGVVSHIYIWGRALTAAECDSVADNIGFVLTEY